MVGNYTPQEAAVLAGASLGAVQKAITTNAVEASVESGRRRLTSASIYAIAIHTSAPATWRISYRDLGHVVPIILHGKRHLQPIPLDAKGAWVLDPRPIVREVDARMRLYDRAKMELIDCNPEILGGTPVIKGTRLSVHAIAGRLDDGDTIDELLAEYPYVTREQVEAAKLYAKANPRRGRPGGRPWASKSRSSS